MIGTLACTEWNYTRGSGGSDVVANALSLNRENVLIIIIIIIIFFSGDVDNFHKFTLICGRVDGRTCQNF